MGAGICFSLGWEKWDLSYWYWDLQSLKQWNMGMGFIFSSDTLGFLIIGTGILRKIRLGNGIKSPLSGSSTERLCLVLLI